MFQELAAIDFRAQSGHRGHCDHAPDLGAGERLGRERLTNACGTGECLARKGLAREGLAREGLAREGLTRKCLAREGLAREGLTREGLAGEGLTREGLTGERLTGERLPGEDIGGERLARERLTGECLAGKGLTGEFGAELVQVGRRQQLLERLRDVLEQNDVIVRWEIAQVDLDLRSGRDLELVPAGLSGRIEDVARRRGVARVAAAPADVEGIRPRVVARAERRTGGELGRGAGRIGGGRRDESGRRQARDADHELGVTGGIQGRLEGPDADAAFAEPARVARRCVIEGDHLGRAGCRVQPADDPATGG